jgi:hypothetical protein
MLGSRPSPIFSANLRRTISSALKEGVSRFVLHQFRPAQGCPTKADHQRSTASRGISTAGITSGRLRSDLRIYRGPANDRKRLGFRMPARCVEAKDAFHPLPTLNDAPEPACGVRPWG